MIHFSVSSRQGVLTSNADTLAQLNISRRFKMESVPTYDISKLQHAPVWRDAVIQDVTRQIAQPDESVVSQLNIRQRMTDEESGCLVQTKVLEVRPECTTEQSDFDSVKKLADDLLPEEGHDYLMEFGISSSDELQELISEDLDKLLSDFESSGSLQPTEVVSSEPAVIETVFPNEEQNQMTGQPVVPSGIHPSQSQSHPTSTATNEKSFIALYSPSPHFNNTNAPTSIAVHNPLSPTGITGITGNLLQQLTINNGTPMVMAISGSVGRPVQLTPSVPVSIQVCN